MRCTVNSCKHYATTVLTNIKTGKKKRLCNSCAEKFIRSGEWKV